MSAALIQPLPSTAPGSIQPFVLVASDDRSEWSSVRDLLSDGGYTLVRAANFREFERALRELPVAVVIAEEHALGHGWREFATRLSGEERRPLLIVCSKDADEDLWLDVLDNGGFDVFAKPLPPRLFRDRVEAAVADWLWLR